jgi:hypothetical protein
MTGIDSRYREDAAVDVLMALTEPQWRGTWYEVADDS